MAVEAERLDLRSLDIAAEKRRELLSLFPEVETAGGLIDFDRLRLALGDAVTVKSGADLYSLSDERAAYEQGFSVAEINAEPGNEYVRFSNGLHLRPGGQVGGMREDIWRAQIKHTVRRHLDRELLLQVRGIKVLSLFFIDRVANYRDLGDSGQPVPGKFASAIEEELAAAAGDAKYQALEWLKLPPSQLHDGYFAQDKRGFKDTRGDSKDDEVAYELIMKEKEKLLSVETPLRFIFSHSALREGWDNPNVFQICTLNEAKSAIKKRQEIGRGLRLPVDRNGVRVFDQSINKLYVMANESYEEFARGLQKEYEEDCDVTFGRVPLTAFAKLGQVVDGEERPIGRGAAELIQAKLISQGMLDAQGHIQPAFNPRRAGFAIDLPVGYEDLEPAVTDLLASYQIERHVRRERDEGPNRLRKEVQLSPEFQELWERIKPKTTYRVEFDTDELVRRSVVTLRRMERIDPPIIRVKTGQVETGHGGVGGRAINVAEERLFYDNRPLPDILGYLQNETELTRSTLFRVLTECGRLAEFFNDPQRFMDAVARILKNELHRLLVDGIKYERIPGTGPNAEWEMMRLESEELINYLAAQKVNHSLYEYVVCESEVERKFAEQLDSREDIKLFVKLPSWFKVDTPVGTYNPDWAIVKHGDQTVYLIRETKGTKDFLKLRNSEADKVRCGEKHFQALGVPFAVVVSADEF